MDAEFPIKVREVKVRHKNGLTYVERRQYRSQYRSQNLVARRCIAELKTSILVVPLATPGNSRG